jgi:hypothetical protein
MSTPNDSQKPASGVGSSDLVLHGRIGWHSNSTVYWNRLNGDTVPALVKAVSRAGGRVQILANCREGDRLVWVSGKRLMLQLFV